MGGFEAEWMWENWSGNQDQPSTELTESTRALQVTDLWDGFGPRHGTRILWGLITLSSHLWLSGAPRSTIQNAVCAILPFQIQGKNEFLKIELLSRLQAFLGLNTPRPSNQCPPQGWGWPFSGSSVIQGCAYYRLRPCLMHWSGKKFPLCMWPCPPCLSYL